MPAIENSTDIQSLFPSEVVVQEMTTPALFESLHPAEQACMDKASLRRRLDFAAGRVCARQALARLGVVGFPLLMGKKGEPVWPPGVVGSISHCDGRGAAAVARECQVRGLGLDMERIRPLGRGAVQLVCTPQELHWIDSLSQEQRDTAAILLFSAKESFYKCQFPLTGRWLDFHDVQVTVHAEAHEFEATIAVRGRPGDVICSAGRYILRDDYICTGLAAPAVGRSIRP